MKRWAYDAEQCEELSNSTNDGPLSEELKRHGKELISKSIGMMRSSDEIHERSFEGNAQSTRVLSRLAFRSKDDQEPIGLNPMLRSLAATAKYPWLKGGHPARIEKLRRKWSFYGSEAELLERLISEGYVLPELDENGEVLRVYRWVEAEIMDWADDISYAVHDLEDFYRAGLIPLEQISNTLTQWRNANWVETDFSFVRGEDLESVFKFIRGKLMQFALRTMGDQGDAIRIVRRAFTEIQELSKNMPTSSFSGSRKAHADLREFSSTLIQFLSERCRLEYDHGVNRLQLHIDDEALLVAEFFKGLNKVYVIESAMLVAAQYGQSKDIYALCDSLGEIAREWLGDGKNAEFADRSLPPRLREYLEEARGPNRDFENDSERRKHATIAVIDYVCSLSDFQASRLAAHLTSSSAMGVLDGRWLDL